MLPFYSTDLLDQLPDDARLGVIGNPIVHSKSPQMQQPALDAAGIPARYVRLLAGTEEGAFEALLGQLAARGFIGVNVTVPFKKRAHDAAVSLDPLAQLSGAVNTLVRRADGSLYGDNTDYDGFSHLTDRPHQIRHIPEVIQSIWIRNGSPYILTYPHVLTHFRYQT